MNLAHLGLAVASLLTWIAYLVTGVLGVAWTACAVLPLVIGLGMTLVFLPSSAISADAAEGKSSDARRRPAFIVGAHIAGAIATILFAVLTVIGAG